MIGVELKVKNLFFDRPAVLRAVDRANRRGLSRAGGLVRKTAMFSIKSRVAPSAPGQPPHSHIGAKRRRLNRKLKEAGQAPVRGGFKGIKHILYGYDPVRKNVVVGPISNRRGVVTNLLEFGGTVTARRARMIPTGKRGRDKQGRYTKMEYKRVAAGTSLKYEPRPYMRPALAKTAPAMPKFWKDAVR